jgi:flagellar hook-associated protein 1 FlgK
MAPLPVSGGSLAGLVDVADATAARRTELDTIATGFAASVNAWSAQGRTASGTAGAPLVEAPAGAASLRLLTSDPAAIAGAFADGTANGNLLALNALRGSDGAETRWGALVAGHALTLSSARSEASAATSRRDNSFGARDEVTGVDLDHEAAELMRYQQAYGGATRIIQVARETMQSILDLF